MRRRALTFCFVLGICSAACTSYDEIQKTESLIEQSIERFHEQLSAEQYHEIYAQADTSLQHRISEDEFVKQLIATRARTGKISGKAYVFIDQSLSKQIHDLLTRTQMVSSFQTASCDTGTAVERFQWSVENENIRLVDYELRQILERGKVYGIGPANH